MKAVSEIDAKTTELVDNYMKAVADLTAHIQTTLCEMNPDYYEQIDKFFRSGQAELIWTTKLKELSLSLIIDPPGDFPSINIFGIHIPENIINNVCINDEIH